MQKVLKLGVVIVVLVLAAMAVWRVTTPARADRVMPSSGWTLHIDALQHFANHPSEVAHHWCKPVSGGLTECQIYSSDDADARLIAVETIVSPAVYSSFTAQEKAMWHYHKVEIPKVQATMPDVTPAVQAATFAQIADTYGKIYVLWDPMTANNPVGRPTITVLK